MIKNITKNHFFFVGIIQSSALRSQNLVEAYFSIRQLLPFCFTKPEVSKGLLFNWAITAFLFTYPEVSQDPLFDWAITAFLL